MKHFISFVAVLIFAGCGEWKALDYIEGKTSPEIPKKPYPKHDPNSCPMELVGKYEEDVKTQDLVLKFYMDAQGVLVGLPIFEKSEMWEKAAIADGFTHETNDGHRTSYCEDHKVVTFGELSGQKFNLVVIKTDKGLNLKDGNNVYKFKRME